jgi:MFS family permease
MSVSTKGPLPASWWFLGALRASAFVVARGYGIWGRLSDFIGRRPILIVDLIGFAVTLAASSLVPSLPVPYVGRILNGGLAAGFDSAARVPPLRKSSRCLSRPPGFWPLL